LDSGLFGASFDERRISIGPWEVALVEGGAGPPLLLLHGFPQTGSAWHRVAPGLADHHRIVVVDLPGYGHSAGPRAEPDGSPYDKRSMASVLREVMARLGYERFAVAGHDRGGRVGYRMALDAPDVVTALAVLDMVPTLDTVEPYSWRRARASYHWSFLAQPAPLPEKLIGGDPDFFLEWTLNSWTESGDAFDPRALADYRRCFRRPEVVAAACADYRAGLEADLAADRADRRVARQLACPLLVLWARRDTDGGSFNFPVVWCRWAERVVARSIAAGHFLMEEAPNEVLEALCDFLAEPAARERGAGRRCAGAV